MVMRIGVLVRLLVRSRSDVWSSMSKLPCGERVPPSSTRGLGVERAPSRLTRFSSSPYVLMRGRGNPCVIRTPCRSPALAARTAASCGFPLRGDLRTKITARDARLSAARAPRASLAISCLRQTTCKAPICCRAICAAGPKLGFRRTPEGPSRHRRDLRFRLN